MDYEIDGQRYNPRGEPVGPVRWISPARFDAMKAALLDIERAFEDIDERYWNDALSDAIEALSRGLEAAE